MYLLWDCCAPKGTHSRFALARNMWNKNGICMNVIRRQFRSPKKMPWRIPWWKSGAPKLGGEELLPGFWGQSPAVLDSSVSGIATHLSHYCFVRDRNQSKLASFLWHLVGDTYPCLYSCPAATSEIAWGCQGSDGRALFQVLSCLQQVQCMNRHTN